MGVSLLYIILRARTERWFAVSEEKKNHSCAGRGARTTADSNRGISFFFSFSLSFSAPGSDRVAFTRATMYPISLSVWSKLVLMQSLGPVWRRIVNHSVDWHQFRLILETVLDLGVDDLDAEVQGAILVTALAADLAHEATPVLGDGDIAGSEIAPGVAALVRVVARHRTGGILCHRDSGLWNKLADAAPSHLAAVPAADAARLLCLAAAEGVTAPAVRILLHWSDAVDAAERVKLVVADVFASATDRAAVFLMPLYRLHALGDNDIPLAYALRVWLVMRLNTATVRGALAAAYAALHADRMNHPVVLFFRSEMPEIAAWLAPADVLLEYSE